MHGFNGRRVIGGFRNANKSYGQNRKQGNFNRYRGGGAKLNPTLFVKKAALESVPATEVDSNVLFADYKIADILKRNIREHGYLKPMPIQEKTIPQILAGRDVIGMANTGSGKTAAFLITLINKVYAQRGQKVLIVVPTRELAIQIRDEFRIFSKGMNLEAVAVIGGANIRNQMFSLRNNPSFVIGTPGRLKDLIERRALNLSLFQNVVLDEVDRMVDIGFLEDIKYLVALLSHNRQSLFFSATVDYKTREVLNRFVTNPVTVSVKLADTAANIEQDVVRVPQGQEKIEVLHDLLNKPGFDKVIIFGRTKWGTEKLSNLLIERGFKAVSIHGNKSQNQRQRALTLFKQNHARILIATDVASRGLDIDNVTHVINYDAPTSYDDYVHRIGRTGRAGKPGMALTFLD